MSYFDDNEDYIIYGRQREFDDPCPRDLPTCKKCGVTCMWGINAAGKWQLFNISREGSEGNRNVPHQCNPTTADDFEALD